MRSTRTPKSPIPGGFGFPLGFLLAIISTFVAVAAGATTHPQRVMIALAITTAAVAGLSTLRAGLATAAVGSALHAGFVLGRHGDLALTPQAGRDAIVLCAVAVIAFLLATAFRATRPVAVRRPAGSPPSVRTLVSMVDWSAASPDQSSGWSRRYRS